MAIDPRNLRPGELCRLLNSTPLGTVINERQLYRHRNRAGYRLGDGNRIDLLKYVAWLVEEVHRPRAETPTDTYAALAGISSGQNWNCSGMVGLQLRRFILRIPLLMHRCWKPPVS